MQILLKLVSLCFPISPAFICANLCPSVACIFAFVFAFQYLIHTHDNTARGFTAEDAFDLRFDVGQFDFAIDEAIKVRR
jgi:hypothetical protein